MHDFGPTSDWIPPSMCVDRKLQEMMLKRKLSPNILYELVIPKEEQLSGELSQKTFTDFMNKLKSVDEDQDIHSSMENFLSVQTVSDKTIADGVEALVGVYLKVRLCRPYKLCYNVLSVPELRSGGVTRVVIFLSLNQSAM